MRSILVGALAGLVFAVCFELLFWAMTLRPSTPKAACTIGEPLGKVGF